MSNHDKTRKMVPYVLNLKIKYVLQYTLLYILNQTNIYPTGGQVIIYSFKLQIICILYNNVNGFFHKY